MKINFIKAFEDNYIWTIEKGDKVILIDPGEARPCFKYLEDKNLYAILLTHKHMDHVGGVKELKEKFIDQIKADKGYIVTVKTLEMNNPSEKTITLKFTGTFEFRPMILRKLVIFDLPVESRAKVIRFDLE